MDIYIQYKFHEVPSIGYLVMAEDGIRTDGQRQISLLLPSAGDKKGNSVDWQTVKTDGMPHNSNDNSWWVDCGSRLYDSWGTFNFGYLYELLNCVLLVVAPGEGGVVTLTSSEFLKLGPFFFWGGGGGGGGGGGSKYLSSILFWIFRKMNIFGGIKILRKIFGGHILAF